jgi:hypothetical protein
MTKRRIVEGVALALGTLIIAGGLAAVLTGGHDAAASNRAMRHSPARSRSTSTTTASLAPNGWHSVAPATTVPQQTPLQQQYDKGFEEGFSSAANKAMIVEADALSLPDPSIAGGWPELEVNETPDGWASEFVAGLLHISFARQSREALGAWLVAQEAPDLMPGIPAGFEERALYVSVLEPAILGESSMLPSPIKWAADAAAGVTWSASDLEVQLEPQWQSMIDAGWQPPDIRAAVEDVSGVLSVIDKGRTTTERFSVVVHVGSAHWRNGYGTVLVSGWKAS